MKTNIKNHWKIVILAAFFSFTGCSVKAPSGSGSRVSIQFPNAEQLNQHLRTQLPNNYDFTKACFAVNVRGGSIPTSSASSCDVPIGDFSGFVAPGAAATVTIPQGTGYTLEVFSYLRSSSVLPCPSNPSNMVGLDKTQIVRIGQQTFDAQAATVEVDVALVQPAPNSNLITQYSLPAVCIPPQNNAANSAAVTSGRAVASAGNYIAVTAVSGVSNEKKLTGGNYIMQLSRRSQDH